MAVQQFAQFEGLAKHRDVKFLDRITLPGTLRDKAVALKLIQRFRTGVRLTFNFVASSSTSTRVPGGSCPVTIIALRESYADLRSSPRFFVLIYLISHLPRWLQS